VGFLLLFLPVIGFPMLGFGKSSYVYGSETVVNTAPVYNQPVNNDVFQQPVQEPVNNDESMKVCPQCNNKVSKDSEFCFICGYKF